MQNHKVGSLSSPLLAPHPVLPPSAALSLSLAAASSSSTHPEHIDADELDLEEEADERALKDQLRVQYDAPKNLAPAAVAAGVSGGTTAASTPSPASAAPSPTAAGQRQSNSAEKPEQPDRGHSMHEGIASELEAL